MACTNQCLVLIAIAYFTKCSEYYVKPEDSSATCCLTLSEYLQDPTTYFTSGSTFTLLQGQHLLNQTLALSGVTGFNLRGSGRNKSLILFQKGGSIALKNCTQIKMSSLEILYAGRNETSHTAVTVEESEVQIFNMKFSGDEGTLYSQGIRLSHSSASFVNCSFTKWYSLYGGAVSSVDSNISFSGFTKFIHNTAKFGGGVYANSSNITFTGTSIFKLNLVDNSTIENSYSINDYPCGAGLYSTRSSILFSGLNIFNNNNINDGLGSALRMNQSSLKILNEAAFVKNNNFALYGVFSDIVIIGDEILFSNNSIANMGLLSCQFLSDGSINFLNTNPLSLYSVYVLNSTAEFRGKTTVSNNHCTFFGYISYILFKGETNFINNYNEDDGGAISLNRSTLEGNGNITFANNTSQGNGGAITLQQSILASYGNIIFANNTSQRNGGAITLQRSALNCSESIIFVNNTSQGKGGDIILKTMSFLKSNGKANFVSNTAGRKGGGVYASNSTINISGICSFLGNRAVEGAGIALEEEPSVSAGNNKHSQFNLHLPVEVIFENNTAVSNGGALFIMYDKHCDEFTSQKSCFFSLETEKYASSSTTYLQFVLNKAKAGAVLYGGHLGSCYAEVNRQKLTYGSESLEFFNKISHINSSTNSSIFIVPVLITICNDTQESIHAERGKNFTLSVTVWGQGHIAVASTIRAYIENDSLFPSVLTPQSHEIENSCSDITFQLNAKESRNTLVLYPDGPCRHKLKKVNVILASCPPAFYLNGIYCRCNKQLQKLSDIVKCDDEKLLVLRLGNSWIYPEWGNNMTETVFIYHENCPSGFCKSNSEHIILNESYTALCSTHRTGLLCGKCEEGYSLTLNSFSCKKCPNRYISLLLFFGFAGVALIAMLLALHMTVAAGTINGLILYANIVNVNSITFYPANHTNILTVFISWLNLDFGIDSCFYDGLDFYSYAWLQYVFPFYLWFLISMIILSNKLSAKVGKLFGSNPVAVLATVMLMSYTKLLQATILTLSSTTLMFTNEASRKVWLYDANVTYFKGKHALLIIMAFFVISLLVPYSILMLLGYRFQAFSSQRAFWWFNKFTPLLDAYYAPYHSKMRFWPGLMLLVRVSLYMVTALSNSSNIKLLAMLSLFIAVLSLPQLSYRVYKKFYNGFLEVLFTVNICLLSATTLYVGSDPRKQEIVTYSSISIALFQFFGIFCFHLFFSLQSTKLIKTLLARSKAFALKLKLMTVKTQPPIQPEKRENKDGAQVVSKTVVELREPLLSSVANL